MNLRDWANLVPGEFARMLRERDMTLERYEELVASIEADERMAEALRATGLLPDTLPESKLGDSLS